MPGSSYEIFPFETILLLPIFAVFSGGDSIAAVNMFAILADCIQDESHKWVTQRVLPTKRLDIDCYSKDETIRISQCYLSSFPSPWTGHSIISNVSQLVLSYLDERRRQLPGCVHRWPTT